MLIEIFSDAKTIYVWAPVKPFDIIDLVGLKFEAELNPETPEELFAGIPESEMKVTDVVRKAVSADLWRQETGDLEGVYEVDEVVYLQVPTWSWFDILTFSNTNPEAGATWTKSGKQKHPVGYKGQFSAHVAKALKRS